MLPSHLSQKQLIAFKIGARARKFLLEDCLVEGYDYLVAYLEDAKERDPELAALLQTELEKFEKRVETSSPDPLS
ncbi:MAG: hypothetical protein H7308_01860 [Chthonomonadaceae bacterium]|nr:hypothetical protein [Chthonomonadaceae bacterium]